uniref:Uncharacterized protein n=1 Tax=Kwoniella bestiolae CBS 10118 TaxID=1296100 RepID=A0A1B9G1Z4_9TREE|nr:hypothetical protein I302_04849 [Kwoniella bestiolae CBS 10118]OCF25039.1 hypothetical protein I302_04849 [Kwoniella bestiolae CBS 10118]
MLASEERSKLAKAKELTDGDDDRWIRVSQMTHDMDWMDARGFLMTYDLIDVVLSFLAREQAERHTACIPIFLFFATALLPLNSASNTPNKSHLFPTFTGLDL